ncbi:Putative inner membrane protein YjeT (clustered with HflC), partial [Salmonella enterica subsp. enterica serovar Bredeney]
EFNNLVGACSGISPRRAGTNAVSRRMEKNGFGTGATAGKCFTTFWRRTCGCGSCGLLHVEENDWL